jgi:hypothetical protein
MEVTHMNSTIISYIAAISSFIAIIISILNWFIATRRLKVEAITKNRIEWIKDVRNILYLFANAYRHINEEEMSTQYTKLMPFISLPNDVYQELITAMDVCISDRSYDETHSKNLIKSTQDTLKSAWALMKKEAGIILSKKEKELIAKSMGQSSIAIINIIRRIISAVEIFRKFC